MSKFLLDTLVPDTGLLQPVGQLDVLKLAMEIVTAYANSKGDTRYIDDYFHMLYVRSVRVPPLLLRVVSSDDLFRRSVCGLFERAGRERWIDLDTFASMYDQSDANALVDTPELKVLCIMTYMYAFHRQ